jgi:hypothetical protein
VALLVAARLDKKKFQTALQDDLADELNGDINALPATRSLLDVSVDELAARVIVELNNTLVDVLIFDSNATNATFTVSEAVAALEAIFSDSDSRLRSNGFVQADSIQSISSGSVSAGELVLCGDGIQRESCPSAADDDGLAIGLGVAAAVCVVVVAVLLVLRLRQQRATASKVTYENTEAAAQSDDPPAVDVEVVEHDPVTGGATTEA